MSHFISNKISQAVKHLPHYLLRTSTLCFQRSSWLPAPAVRMVRALDPKGLVFACFCRARTSATSATRLLPCFIDLSFTTFRLLPPHTLIRSYSSIRLHTPRHSLFWSPFSMQTLLPWSSAPISPADTAALAFRHVLPELVFHRVIQPLPIVRHSFHPVISSPPTFHSPSFATPHA